MTVTDIHDLRRHIGHKIVVATYGTDDDPESVCVECEDCHEVLYEEHKHPVYTMIKDDRHPVYTMVGDEYADIEIRLERELMEQISEPQDKLIQWLMDGIKMVIMQAVEEQKE